VKEISQMGKENDVQILLQNNEKRD